jgi:hypothetical protein
LKNLAERHGPLTARQARQILLLYRPWTDDAEDPEIREAMRVATEVPEVAAWFEQHCRFQEVMRNRLRSNLVVSPRRASWRRPNDSEPLPLTQRPWLWLAIGALFLALCKLGSRF